MNEIWRKIEQYKEVVKIVRANSAKIDELFRKHIVNPEINCLKIKKLVLFLKDLSQLYQFDFIPAFDYINTMNLKRDTINIDTFLENIILWLNFQRKILENPLISEEKMLDKFENLKHLFGKGVLLTLQQRSLFILKKKFEKHKYKITDLLTSNTNFNYKIQLNKLIRIIQHIFEITLFSLYQIESYKDIFDPNVKRKSLLNNKVLLNELICFTYSSIDNYNQHYKNVYKYDDDQENEIFFLDLNRKPKNLPAGEFPNFVPLIYYESLQMILADFIFNNLNYVVLDLNDEFKEHVNVMFDMELVEKIKSHDNTINSKKEKISSKEEIRNNNLKRLFLYYCRQHDQFGEHPTFETIDNVMSKMNFSEFLGFCNDFNIPLKKKDISSLYLEISKDLIKDINFSEFMILLNKFALKINEKQRKKLEKMIKMIETGKVVNKEKSNIFMKHSPETKLSNLITKPAKNEVYVHPPAITSKTAKKILKANERKNIISEQNSKSPLAHDDKVDSKDQGLNKDTVIQDKNKKKIEVSIDKNKKQVEKDSTTKNLENNSKDTDKNKVEEVKQKTEKKANEKQAHKDAIVPKLLDNNKTTKNNNKKETNEEINDPNPEKGIKIANDEQKMEEKVYSPKKIKNHNKNYKISEDKVGFKYEHSNYRPVLKIPFTKTREILHSKVPEKIDKYEDIKLILQDKDTAKNELQRCKEILSTIKSKDFPLLQEDFFTYLNLDDIAKLRENLLGFPQAFGLNDRVPENYLNLLSEKFKEEVKPINAVRFYIESKE